MKKKTSLASPINNTLPKYNIQNIKKHHFSDNMKTSQLVDNTFLSFSVLYDGNSAAEHLSVYAAKDKLATMYKNNMVGSAAMFVPTMST